MSVEIPVLGRVTWQGVALGILLGVVLAPQVRKIPLVSKLPTV